MNPTSATVLVTGATSGIGQAIATGFALSGEQVLGVGMGSLPSNDTQIHFENLDVQDNEAVLKTVSVLRQLRVVVNCAGVIHREAEHEPDVFQRVVDINLTGTMRVCSAARTALAANRGAIINIASMLSYFGGGLVPAYSASKGGVVQLTKSLAIAYAAEGIRVNALAPGWIATPLTQSLQTDTERSRALLERTPLGRWGTPQDLVGPALFLASRDSHFITGTTLDVDGGYAVM